MENGNKLLAAISYIGILFLVPLLAAKDDAFARYHANQGLVLFLVGIVIGIVGVIPVVGTIIALVGGIATFVFAILGIVNAATGKMSPLPLIGGIQIIK